MFKFAMRLCIQGRLFLEQFAKGERAECMVHLVWWVSSPPAHDSLPSLSTLCNCTKEDWGQQKGGLLPQAEEGEGGDRVVPCTAFASLAPLVLMAVLSWDLFVEKLKAPSRCLKAHGLVQLARGLSNGHGLCSAKQDQNATAVQ